jgi:1-acyl-sn-glycerol-3-phosphate acyltransferase
MKPEPNERTKSRGSVRRAGILAIGGLIFWMGSAVFSLLAILFFPLAGKPSVRRQARRILRRLFRFWMGYLSVTCGVRFELVSPKRFQEIRGTVVVANHPTLMDALYLLGLVPDAVCIIKKSLQRNLLLGPIARLCGFIANEAGPDLVREAGAALSEGCNLIIFPEGTRSRGSLRPFKPGFALIATRFKAPVQTVHLSCEPPFLPGRVEMKGIPGVAPVVSVRPGRVFRPVTGSKAARFMAEIETYYRGELCNGPTATLS